VQHPAQRIEPVVDGIDDDEADSDRSES